MLLNTRRHNNINHQIGEFLETKKYTYFLEACCLDTESPTKFVNILVCSAKGKETLLVDPTIRFKANDEDQDHKIQKDKEKMYKKYIPYLQDREEFGER